MKRITREDVDTFLGFSKDKAYRSLKGLEDYDLQYEICSELEERKEILDELKRIKTDTQVVGTPERTEIWENGWRENLEKFRKTLSIDALAPMYFRPDCPSRLNSHFVYPSSQLFDYYLEKVIKGCILEEFAKESGDIYEFGCGTCADIYDISRLFPDKKIHCRDLTKSSIEISDILKDKFDVNIASSSTFDFTAPDWDSHLVSGAVVYTFSALEQIYDNYRQFIAYLLNEKPLRVIHLEPMNEVYNEEDIVDWVALQFHEKRHYLHNFYLYMRELENQGLIRILFFRRTGVGGLNHESNTILVWEPI